MTVAELDASLSAQNYRVLDVRPSRWPGGDARVFVARVGGGAWDMVPVRERVSTLRLRYGLGQIPLLRTRILGLLGLLFLWRAWCSWRGRRLAKRLPKRRGLGRP